LRHVPRNGANALHPGLTIHNQAELSHNSAPLQVAATSLFSNSNRSIAEQTDFSLSQDGV
jgi:hypothetical protein